MLEFDPYNNASEKGGIRYVIAYNFRIGIADENV